MEVDRTVSVVVGAVDVEAVLSLFFVLLTPCLFATLDKCPETSNSIEPE